MSCLERTTTADQDIKWSLTPAKISKAQQQLKETAGRLQSDINSSARLLTDANQRLRQQQLQFKETYAGH
jgi:hypothetical protein